jgi:hypothetical protein
MEDGMRKTLVGGLIGAMTATAACLSTTGPNTERTSAVVTGQVTRPDGTTPVGGPLITVQLLGGQTGNSAQLLGTGVVTGADNGRFLILFLLNSPVQTGSAIINVSPAPGQGLLPFDTAGIPVKILPGEQPAESTYVQMSLKAR